MTSGGRGLPPRAEQNVVMVPSSTDQPTQRPRQQEVRPAGGGKELKQVLGLTGFARGKKP
jgi:hypothetical protein